jgi:hypothetical protein
VCCYAGTLLFYYLYQNPVILRLASLLTQKLVACFGLLEANEVTQKWEQKPLRSQKSIFDRAVPPTLIKGAFWSPPKEKKGGDKKTQSSKKSTTVPASS